MPNELKLGVYRNLEDQRKGLPHDSPLTFELHARRGRALHAIFDGDPDYKVVDWGDTDSKEPHEFVSITLVVLAKFAVQQALLPGLLWLGPKLAEKLVEDQLIEAAKDVVGKIWPKMKSRDIDEAQVSVPVAGKAPNASTLTILVIHNEAGGTISINSASGPAQVFNNIEGGASP